MPLDIRSTMTMNDGRAIPRLGLGVFRAPPGAQTQQAVEWALELGYRHIDTAAVYGNERDVGAAIRASKVPRQEVFVTTKLWNDDQGQEKALAAARRSLERLGLDWIDLYLIHWPVEGLRVESWEACLKLREEGVCRSIGVSNFEPRHLEELAVRGLPVPAVNQVEMSPFLAQKPLREYCAKKGILIEAYSPLTKARRLEEPALRKLAQKHGKAPAQVLIRWALQQEVIVLPKSVRRERIAQNASVYDFELDAQDLAALDGLDGGYRTSWDPTEVP